MQRLLYLSDELCGLEVEGRFRFGSFEKSAARLDRQKPLLVAVIPTQSVVLAASEKTVESAASAHFGGSQSFVIEPFGENRFQVHALPDELLKRLLSLSASVKVVPYALALRSVLRAAPPPVTGLRRLTKLFKTEVSGLAGPSLPPPPPVAPEVKAPTGERVAVDEVDGATLLTILRHEEVLEVRLIPNGDPIVELQRTAAAVRLEAPVVYCVQPEVQAELSAQEYQAVCLPAVEGLIGVAGLESTVDLRFRAAAEVALERNRLQRRNAVAALSLGASALALAGLFWGYQAHRLSKAEEKNAALTLEAGQVRVALELLFREKHPAVARKESISVHQEMFDLLLALPPQVKLLGLDKTRDRLQLSVERRADAAPFTRTDLEAALRSSPAFAGLTITEEYDGHVIRYLLSGPTADAAPPVTVAGGAP